MSDRRVYHYTDIANKLPLIIGSGGLMPTNTFAENERPLIWFTTSPDFEPTATRGIYDKETGETKWLTVQEQEKMLGLCRFLLPATDKRLMNWKKACVYAGTPKRIRVALEKYAREKGSNTKDFFAVAPFIPLSELSFERWTGQEWLNCDDDLARIIAESDLEATP
ncbi:hypothetical protein SAMN06295888_1135 [Desulfonatronum zhilinae]|nr:hypothetical protein SAMN06295888_1135 [Desulfonatronum zhilinae]